MSIIKNAALPAFGFHHPEEHGGHCNGLSKREYFIGIAFAALIGQYNLEAPEIRQTIADMAIELADTLLNTIDKTY